MTRRHRAIAAAVALLAGACGPKRAELPTADSPPQPPPLLIGQSIMVLPAQTGAWTPARTARAAPAGIDRELVYWLEQRAPNARWIAPTDLERVVARSPGFELRLRALPVADFRRAALTRVGDPLFGDLRRLGAVVDARYALVPVASAFLPDSAAPANGRVELALALIDTLGGSVLWFGVVEGDAVPYDDPRATSSAAEAAAQALVP